MPSIPASITLFYQNFRFTPTIVNKKIEKRKLVKMLPAILQTQTLQKFFGSSGDHLFQPGNAENVAGLIGEKPSYWDPATEYYVRDITPEREFYQLEPAMSTTDSMGEVDNFLFYPDLLNVLKRQGAFINNHQRLFEEEYWTWVPPVDLDMFTNYRQYYWLAEGAPIRELRGHKTSFTCDGISNSFNIKTTVDGILPANLDFKGIQLPTNDEKNFVRVKLNGYCVPFEYQNGVVTLSGPPANKSIVEVWIPSDFNKQIIGQLKGSFVNEFSLTSGMRIAILNDRTESYNDKVYIVQGVGKSIWLLLDENYKFDSSISDLPVVIRGEKTSFTGNGTTKTFNIKPTADGSMPANPDFTGFKIPTSKKDIRVSVDNVDYTTFAYNNGIVTIDPAPATDLIIEIWIPSDFDHKIIGWKNYSFKNDATITSYTQYLIENDVNKSLNGNTFVVLNVGTSIIMYSYNKPNLLSELDPEYIVMERGSLDQNRWSTYNRWFHKSLLTREEKRIYRSRRAHRPIVCFERNLELYNAGLYKRNNVQLVSTEIKNISNALSDDLTYLRVPVDGQDVTAQWVYSQDNHTCRLLVLKDTNPVYNNRIYNVICTKVLDDETNPLYLQLNIVLDNDGLDPTGSPSYGEVVEVDYGLIWTGKRVYFDGSTWQVAQQKTEVNQIPNFQLYDIDGTKLNDPAVYPNSTFTGNPIFNYLFDSTKSSPADPVLKRNLTYDTAGHILFQNYLPMERYFYKLNLTDPYSEILGYYYNKVYNINPDLDFLSNDWWSKDNTSNQWINEETMLSNEDRFANFSTVLESRHFSDELNSILDTTLFEVLINGRISQQNVNWFLDRPNNRILVIKSFDPNIRLRDPVDGDRIQIRSLSFVTPFKGNSFYEIPSNLKSNPTNEYITDVSYYDIAEHLSNVILKQRDFTGYERDNNNWRDSQQDRSRGGLIVQHSSSLLRLMLLASRTNLDWTTILRWGESEYVRFRARFEQKMGDLLKNGAISSFISPSDSVDKILEQLNFGKNNTFLFFTSGMAKKLSTSSATFIPPTPAYLGFTPISKPELLLDTSFSVSLPVIKAHDGGSIVGWGNTIGQNTDYRNLIMLELEQRIYKSIPAPIRLRDKILIDPNEYVGNANRQGDYSWTEFQVLLKPNFDRWVAFNKIDTITNTIYRPDDPWTWNYTGCRDWLGRLVPGYWRIMYEWLFGTDAPNLRPWEMLGFGSMPNWWVRNYGLPPYTNANTKLWNDLENGVILEGEFSGKNSRLARPGVATHIPVDSQGRLLDPMASRIIPTEPDMFTTSAIWTWKGGSPAESSWKRSVSYSFALAEAIYLTKPARFVETYWTAEYVERIFKNTTRNQLAIGPNKWREPFSEQLFYGETKPDGTVYYPVGIQECLFDWYKSKGQDTKILGNWTRTVQSRLGYKMGGFCDYNTLSFLSDISGALAKQDFSCLLYKSPSVAEASYSGVMIEWTGTGYSVQGYNATNPVFYVKTLLPTSNNYKIELGTTQRLEVPIWSKDTYYTFGTMVRYTDTYYRCVKSHTSSSIFESAYWYEIAMPKYGDLKEIVVYTDIDPTVPDESIPYGTEFRSIQDVVDFLQRYNLWLMSNGWRFEYIDLANNVLMDWKQGIREFLGWSQKKWDAGNFIVLSPSANFVKYVANRGCIEPLQNLNGGYYVSTTKRLSTEKNSVSDYSGSINQSTNQNSNNFQIDRHGNVIVPVDNTVSSNSTNSNTYQILGGGYSSLTDRNGLPVDLSLVDIARDESSITVATLTPNTGIFGARLTINEYEHIVIFKNQTTYGDWLYRPILNVKQSRLRIEGMKTPNWNGRIEAMGFIVSQNMIIPNFEKTADNFRNYFNIEGDDFGEYKTRARHNIGYQKRSFLTDMLLGNVNQFEFYQGMIQEKGTVSSMRKLLRSSFINHNNNMKLLEEWAVRVGDYGGNNLQDSLDIDFTSEDFINDPQIIELNATTASDWNNTIGISPVQQVRTVYEASAVFTGSGIKSIVVTNPGSGYTFTPNVSINGPDGIGTSLSAEMDWTNSSITSITVVSGGNGYFGGDIITFSGTGQYGVARITYDGVNWSRSIIKSIDILDGGLGYQTRDPVVFLNARGGFGGEARVSSVDSNGSILSIEIISAGMKFRPNTRATVVPRTGGRECSLKVNVTGGGIKRGTTAIEVLWGGDGYAPNPIPNFTGSLGSGAILKVNITGGSVSSININDPGTNWFTTPNIIIDARDVNIRGSRPVTNPATAAVTEFTDPILDAYTLIDNLNPGDIFIDELNLVSPNPFGGGNPTFSLGDTSNYESIIPRTLLDKPFIVKKTFTRETPLTNLGEDITIRFYQVGLVGELKVNIKYHYTTQYYTNTIESVKEKGSVLRTIDLYDETTKKFIFRNPRWEWRHKGLTLDWKNRYIDPKEKGMYPTAGYVSVDDVQKSAHTYDDLLLMWDYLRGTTIPPNIMKYNLIKINYSSNQNSDLTIPVSYKLTGRFTNNIFRLRRITVNVVDAFINFGGLFKPTISFGFPTNNQSYVKETEVDITLKGEYDVYPSKWIFPPADTFDNSVYAYVKQRSAYPFGSGKLEISIEMESIELKDMLVWQNVWVYSNKKLEWDVYKLIDSTSRIYHTWNPSHQRQGTVVGVQDTLNMVISDFLIQASGTGYVVGDQIGIPVENGKYEIVASVRTVDSNGGITSIDHFKKDTFFTAKNPITFFPMSGARPGLDLWGSVPPTNSDGTYDSNTYCPYSHNYWTLNPPTPVVPPIPQGAIITPVYTPVLDQRAVIVDGFFGDDPGTQKVQKARTSNYALIKLEPSTSATTFSQIVDMLRLLPEAGMAIDKITVTVTTPFSHGSRLWIGTNYENGNFFAQPQVEPAYALTPLTDTTQKPVTPTFTYGAQPKISIVDTSVVTSAELPATIPVRVVRSGGIFMSPVSITVTGRGRGYDPQNPPQVRVVTTPGSNAPGPTGITTMPLLTGYVSGVLILTNGSGYTSTPSILFSGGNGSGAAGTAVISNGQLTAITITNGGSGYTTAPSIIIAGGGGSGATAQAIMNYGVESITITSTGSCSWEGPSGSATVIIDPPPVAPGTTNPPDATATATLQTWPPAWSADTQNWFEWHWRRTLPVEGATAWSQTHRETFANPGSETLDSHWFVSMGLPVTADYPDQTFEIEILTLGPITTSLGTRTATIRVLKEQEDTYTVNLTKIGTKIIPGKDYTKIFDVNEYPPISNPWWIRDGVYEDFQKSTNELGLDNNPLIARAYLISDPQPTAAGQTYGIPGFATIRIDYSYTKGFELFDLLSDDTPYIKDHIIWGGNVFEWSPRRMGHLGYVKETDRIPSSGWRPNDIIWCDDYRPLTGLLRQWDPTISYEYGSIVLKDGKFYKCLSGGKNLKVSTSITDGKLTGLTIDYLGSYYTRTPKYKIFGTRTAEPKLNIIMNFSKIASVKVISPGSGYSTCDILDVRPEDPDIENHGAAIKIAQVDDNGGIQKIDVVEPGRFYIGSPTVIFSSSKGLGAILEVVLEPTYIIRIDIDNQGAGFTSPPTVVFEECGSKIGTWIAGEWAETSDILGLWGVYTGSYETPVNWHLSRIQTKKMEDQYFVNAQIYDKKTENIDTILQLWDPGKGFIPGVAKKELTYILEVDPAYYNYGTDRLDNINDKLRWGPVQEGQLWWDLSTARFLDYEIDNTSIDYRWKHWGSLAPGISIDVYEWVRSLSPPSLWNDKLEWVKRTGIQRANTITGKPYRIADNTTPYCTVTEWDKATHSVQTVYYFWVKNVEWVFGEGRTLSASQVANIIQNPSAANIPWFAPIDPTHVVVGGVKEWLTDNSVLKITWKKNDIDIPVHHEWKIIRNDDSRSTIPQYLWDSFRYSLVGWDKLTKTQTVKLHSAELIKPGIKRLKVDSIKGLPNKGILNYGYYIFTYEYCWDNILYGFDNPAGATFASGIELTLTTTGVVRDVIPNPDLSGREKAGILRSPRQSWFKEQVDDFGAIKTDRQARQEFIDKINEIFYREPMLTTRFDWEHVFKRADEPMPGSETYNFVMPDLIYRDRQAELGIIHPGQTVLITHLADWQGFWTLWRYEPQNIDSDSAGFLLIRAQKWSMREDEFWERIDWYDTANGWSVSDYPVYRFPSKAIRDSKGVIPVTLLKGTLVLIDDDGTGNWEWDLYDGIGGWVTVAKQRGTVRLKSGWNDTSRVLWGITTWNKGQILNRDMTWELEQFLLNIQSYMLTTQEKNELFFAMLNYVLTQTKDVDWAFKTSFLYISDYAQKLSQAPVSSRDMSSDLLAYINEVKPYHVKIREFVKRYSSGPDQADFYTTDFDKSMYPDLTLDPNKVIYRHLLDDNKIDQLILSSKKPWRDYWDNRNKTNKNLENWDVNWYPIRRNDITIVFDRISCVPMTGWNMIPWNTPIDIYKGLDAPSDMVALLNQWQELPPNYSDYNYRSGTVLPDKGTTLRDVFGVTTNISYWRWTGTEWIPFDFRYFLFDYMSELDDLANRNNNQPVDDPLLQTGDLARVRGNISQPFYMWSGTAWLAYDETTYRSTYGIKPPTGKGYNIRNGSYLPKIGNSKIDFFVLSTTSYYRWNNTKWIPFYYRTLSYVTIDDLYQISIQNENNPDTPVFQTGDIAQLSRDDTKFIWNGRKWIQFEATSWDKGSEGGVADRIEKYYQPTGIAKKKDYNILIKGCDYRGTIVSGGNLLPGLWGKFGWNLNDGLPMRYRTAHFGKWRYDYKDRVVQSQSERLGVTDYVKGTMVWVLDDNSQWIWTGESTDSGDLWRRVYGAGWGNEFDYYVGNDVDIVGKQLKKNEAALPDLYDPITELTKIPTLDVSNRNYTEDSYDPTGISVRGGVFIQPTFDSGRPEEKVIIESRNPFRLTMYQKPSKGSAANSNYSPPSYPVALRMFKGADGYWLQQRFAEGNLSLAATLTNRSTVLDLAYTGGNINQVLTDILYDPMKPNPQILRYAQNNWKYVTKPGMTAIIPPESVGTYSFYLSPPNTSDIPFGLTAGWMLDISCPKYLPYAGQGRVINYDTTTGKLDINVTWFTGVTQRYQDKFEFVPRMAGAFPGYVWVGAELIEYWDISIINNSIVRLGVAPGTAPNASGKGRTIKRGVKGTSYGLTLDTAQQYWAGDGTTDTFKISDKATVYNTWVDKGANFGDVQVLLLVSKNDKPLYWQIQNLNIDYTIQKINNEWKIVFTNAPPSLPYYNEGNWSNNNIAIWTDIVRWKASYVVHPAGTPVYNAGLNDVIPYMNSSPGQIPNKETAWCGSLGTPDEIKERDFMEWIVQSPGPDPSQ